MKNLFPCYKITFNKSILIILISFLCSGCAQWIPGMTNLLDDYFTDDAVSVSVHKAALQRKNDLNVNVQIQNKE